MNKLFTFFRESQTARALIFIGLTLTIFGIIMFAINMKNQNYVKVESTISKVELVEEAHTDANGDVIQATYKVTVKYTANGKEYENELGEMPGSYKEGEKMTIYYNPKDPNKITQTKSLILPIVLTAGGIVALVGGVISGNNALKKHKKMKEQEKEWEKNE